MNDNAYRLTVSVTVSKGRYGYGTTYDEAFEVVAPLDVLQKVDITDSVYNLFRFALNHVAEREEMGDEEN